MKSFTLRFLDTFEDSGFDPHTKPYRPRKGKTYRIYRPQKQTSKAIEKHGGRSVSFSPPFSYALSSKQNVLFKASVKYDKGLHLKHLAYIKREGTGRDGEDPVLYGSDPEQYEKGLSKAHFRFIISPQSQKIDVTVLTKEFIRRLEERTGHELKWAAANHYNTPHQHSHVLINGFDKNRTRIIFSHDEIKSIMRESLRDISTDMIGFRTREEKLADFRNSTGRNSLTVLDQQLAKKLTGSKLSAFDLSRMDRSALYAKRIAHLQSLSLVTFKDRQYIFDPDFQDKLKLYGRYDSFLDGFKRINNPGASYRFHDVFDAGAVTGRIVWNYYMQADSNVNAVLLQKSANEYCYVPLQRGLACKPGEKITVGCMTGPVPAGGGNPKKTIAVTKI